jgi:hypothetical protein
MANGESTQGGTFGGALSSCGSANLQMCKLMSQQTGELYFIFRP